MAFKLKGGRPVRHSKWMLSGAGQVWGSSAPDCNGGTLLQSVTVLAEGGTDARVEHRGYPKFSEELVLLTEITKKFANVDLAKQWCRKTANALAQKHDVAVALTSDDYRQLSLQSTRGSLAPGAELDFGPSQRPMDKFRSRKRRK